MTLAEPDPAETGFAGGAALGAEVRCRTYAHFAAVYGHPDAGVQSALATGQWLNQFAALDDALPIDFPPRLAPSGPPFAVPEYSELAALYTSRFEVGQSSVSLFGRTYLGRDEKSVFEDLFRIYEHFGLTFKEGLPEWPDWIVVELEFMHYLTFLEAGSPGDPAPIQRGERDFLDKHLVPFTRDLALSLEDKAVPVYSEVSRRLATFVAADATYLRTLVGSE